MILIVVTVAGLAAATWLIGGLRSPGRPDPRPDIESGPEAAARSVSVIIPARNEATTLSTLLESLARLDPAPSEIIVVDDESDDGTGGIARRLGATVVTTSPPAGWLGKPWACRTGAAAASGELVVFLDADTWLAPHALESLLAEHDASGGLLSVQPYHVTIAPYEELSAYCSTVAMLGSGAFAAGGAVGAPVAFGPCLMSSAVDYERSGGHDAVRAEVLEDVRLARAYGAAGLPVTSLAGGDTVRFRMYPGGVRQLVDGWTKNIATGAAMASPLAVGATVLWVAAHAAVATAAIVGLARWALWSGDAPVAASVGYVVIAVHQRWLLGRIGSFRWWTAVVFPLPLLAFLWIFARSLVLTRVRGEVTWRGRRIGLRTDERR
jgi:4,4'-diaponeurosporenoate glycosyltransferase